MPLSHRPNRPAVALMPIRQLLKALPDHCLEHTESDDLQQLWSSARWDGLAIGLSAQTQAAMGLALSRVPGTADTQLTPAPSIRSQHLWSTVDTGSSEHALLLFCPTATQDIADEAAWRLLAHLCQTPFYQRLRVELQLGYAVFSGLRQIHGQTGLLFGVQSPSVAPAELLQHIEQFLNELPGTDPGIDDATFIAQRQALADQFASTALPTRPGRRIALAGQTGRPFVGLSDAAASGDSDDRPRSLAGRGPTTESGRRRMALPGQRHVPRTRLGKWQNDHYRCCN